MKKYLLIILAIGLFSCSKENEINPDYYEVNKNDTFDVSLNYAATTGYYWKWIKNQTDKAVDSISVNYIPKKVDAEVIGAGGNEIWKFKGKESGTYILTFEYYRPMEPNSTVETKKITVKIN